MKIKTFKTTVEEVEIDLPEFFEHDGYSYMHRDGSFTRVWTSVDKKFTTIVMSKEMTSSKDLENIKPITREQFYDRFCEAIELSTGFKFNPEPESEAVLNNFSQADSEPNDIQVTKVYELREPGC